MLVWVPLCPFLLYAAEGVVSSTKAVSEPLSYILSLLVSESFQRRHLHFVGDMVEVAPFVLLVG